MPIDLPKPDTSVGPLDIEKRAGEDGEGGPATFAHDHHSSDELLDSRPSATDPTANSAESNSLRATTEPETPEELERRKNPLGYTVTDPTEEEIEEGAAEGNRAFAQR